MSAERRQRILMERQEPHAFGTLASAKKIPGAVCRREGPCGPVPSEGDEPPPYRHWEHGIFIGCGETRFMTTWRLKVSDEG